MFEMLEQRALLSAASDVSILATPSELPPTNTYDLWGLTKVNAPAAWDVTKGSTKVVVADIDTGLDYTHPDLYRNVWVNQGEIPATVKSTLFDVDQDGLYTFWDLNDPQNALLVPELATDANSYIDAGDVLAAWSDGAATSDGNAYTDDLIGWDFVNNDNDPFDDNSHGTHTAGTIAASANDGGVVGMNWQVQLMPLKFLAADGSGRSDHAAAAIRYAADKAPLSNNSWGGGAASDIKAAIDYAQSKNHLVVAAAGNNGVNNDNSLWRSYPASYSNPNILTVAATDRNDGKPSWSNYGKTTVDLGAPGAGIWSTVPGGGYANYDGTSMATPHVTGAAALVLAKNPALSNLSAATNVKTVLMNSVDKVSSMNRKTVTGGRLNVGRAVANAPAATGTVATLATTSPASTTSTGGSIVASVQGGEAGAVFSHVRIGGAADSDRDGLLEALLA